MPLTAEPAARSRGLTLLAWFLIASPLVRWGYVSTLAHFTILEPPYTALRGLPLALHVFFTAGAILPALGVALLYRSEWARRIACVVFGLTLAWTAWLVLVQVVTGRLDSNLPLALGMLALSATCLWYLLRARIRREFRPIAASGIVLQALPPESAAPRSRPLVVMACGEILLGLLAALLLAWLHFHFGARPLLDVGPGIGVTEADELLRTILFVALALLLAPHALTVAASVGILLHRDTLRAARRYLAIAVRTAIGAALVAAWLGWREGFAFETRVVWTIWAFCAVSVAWHGRFLYILGHYPSAR